MEVLPKISVLVITYNQEKIIKRAIDSLLSQREYIYEICVSDDCSLDSTWDVLKTYEKENPGLFKIHRQKQNVGIFKNYEYTWTMPTGDIIYPLSGDDECGRGWFKTVIEFIRDNNIKYKEEPITIYGDYEVRYPSGDSFVFSNSAINSGMDPVRLSIRGIIGNRSAICSRSVLNRYVNVSQGKSHIAESAIDRQLPLFSKKVYYIAHVGNIYYARIGVSSTKDENKNRERENIESYAMQMLLDNGYLVCKSDRAYMLFQDEKWRSYRLRSLSHYVKLIWYKITSFDPLISFKSFRFKRYLFALRLRLPHNSPIRMNV